MPIYRSHTCGDLRDSHSGSTVRLSGWVHRIRDHGGVLFIDLRDNYGITQCVCDPDSQAFATAEGLRAESCIRIDGRVKNRPQDTRNDDIATGAIEVYLDKVDVLGAAEELPLPVFGEPDYPEDIRLTYRFLDLRRPGIHSRIIKRSQIISSLRQRMTEAGFCEFQTPILTASSPEGARDFLVPSRLNPGTFYALPQAPQQFKQLLMIAGFDRYFQIAPCFRDEDARADRSPGEFYQLDIEMSFVTQEDVFQTIEPILRGLYEEFGNGKQVTQSFPRISYHDAMLRYGSDKPDLRFGMEISDLSDLFADETVNFKAFQNVIASGGVVRAIPAPGAASEPRSFFDKLNDWARSDMKAPGLGYLIFDNEGGELIAKGPIAKFIPAPIQQAMAARAGVGAGDALFFAAGKVKDAATLAGQARLKIARDRHMIDESRFAFAWIVDFPMFEWNEEEKRIDFSHNPFSMPQGGLEALNTQDPLTITAYQYDIVCNGIELSSGAIRNHRPDIMRKAFAIAGYSNEELEARFGGMLRALSFGAPPHGGIAPGVDRMVMMLCEEDNLREVTPFPLNQRAQDLLMGAPAPATAQQLQELGLRLMPKKTPASDGQNNDDKTEKA